MSVTQVWYVCVCTFIHGCGMIRKESWTHMKVCGALLWDRERGKERGRDGGRECVFSVKYAPASAAEGRRMTASVLLNQSARLSILQPVSYLTPT